MGPKLAGACYPKTLFAGWIRYMVVDQLENIDSSKFNFEDIGELDGINKPFPPLADSTQSSWPLPSNQNINMPLYDLVFQQSLALTYRKRF